MTGRSLMVFFLIVSWTASAQLSVSLHDTWMRAAQWDEAVRAYNFSRPWQEKQLPFLSHGLQIQLGWYFPVNTSQSLFIHPEAGIARWQAQTKNPGNELKLRVETITLDAHVHFHPKALFNRVEAGPLGTRWFVRISPGITLWQGRIESRGESRLWDEESGEEYRPRALTPSVGIGSGYRAWMIAGQWVLTPRMGVRYTPRVVLDDFVRMLTGTSIFGIPDRADHVLQVMAGLEFTWVIPKKVKSK